MAEKIEPTRDETQVPANPVLDLQAEETEEVQAHGGGGDCVSLVSVVKQ
jgi:hypothetical protein